MENYWIRGVNNRSNRNFLEFSFLRKMFKSEKKNDWYRKQNSY